jgi:hypothetical protein
MSPNVKSPNERTMDKPVQIPKLRLKLNSRDLGNDL